MNYNTLLKAELFSKLLVPFTQWFANDCSKGVFQVTFRPHQHPRGANNRGEPDKPTTSNDFLLIFKSIPLKIIMIITIATNTQSLLCARSFSALNLQANLDSIIFSHISATQSSTLRQRAVASFIQGHTNSRQRDPRACSFKNHTTPSPMLQ